MDTQSMSAKARRGSGGFTFIELLHVIAVIAIIAVMLMPIVNRAKMGIRTAQCLDNMKQLQNAYLMYVHDNNDYLPPNAIIGPNSWISNNNAQVDILFDAIRGGLLYQYNQNVKIYACPANTRTLHPAAQQMVKARQEYGNPGITTASLLPMVRTCSLNYPLGGIPIGNVVLQTGVFALTKYTQIKPPNPAPAQMFVFVDENEYSIDDGVFAIDPTGSGQNRWWNLPGSRHNRGTTWSFADGHVEYWQWHGTAVLNFTADYEPADSSDDLSRVQAGTSPLGNGP